MDQEKRNEMIEQYRRGYDLLKTTLADIPREAWSFKPGPDRWCIHEILVHMKDSELNGILRLHKLIAEPGSTLATYEPHLWSVALNYQNQNVDDALEIFRLLQLTTYRLLKTLPGEVFGRSIVHPMQNDPYTMELWLEIYTEHITEHCEQLSDIHLAWITAGH